MSKELRSRAKPSSNGKRVTSIEVARVAGVSQSTVSRVFGADGANGLVADETTARVMKVAHKLGYRPNALASSLTTRRTDMIGIVMAEITSPFYPYVLEQFTHKLHEIGKRVMLFSAGPDEDVDALIQDVFKYRVDGLIVANATLSSAMVDECLRHCTPLILFNRYVRNAKASAVICDNVAGGRMVADVLLDAGHKRVAYIAGRQNASTHIDREAGFTTRLRERRHTAYLREQGEYTYQSGYFAAKRLLQQQQPPDGIFAANDITAIGAMDAARDLGVQVPNALSIIGFDDIPAASWVAYSLTTVRQPVNQMIDLTIKMLLDRIESPKMKPETKRVPGELARRGSARLARST